MYWDGEATPSVEIPSVDFFGLGLGEYFLYQSVPLAGRPADKALQTLFSPLPFQKHGAITVTNEGKEKVDAFYFNIDYRACAKPSLRTHSIPRTVRQQSPQRVGSRLDVQWRT